MRLASLLLCFFALILFMHSSVYTKTDKKIVTGVYKWNDWIDTLKWPDVENVDFSPDKEKLIELRSVIKDTKFSYYIFASSTCHDCMEEVPKIMNVLYSANIDSTAITIIGVDKNDAEPSGRFASFNIQGTPSLIIKDKDKTIANILAYDYQWLEDILDAFERYKEHN